MLVKVSVLTKCRGFIFVLILGGKKNDLKSRIT